MATFEEILDSLLKDLEKNPQADVNKLAEQSAAKLRLKCDTGVTFDSFCTINAPAPKFSA